MEVPLSTFASVIEIKFDINKEKSYLGYYTSQFLDEVSNSNSPLVDEKESYCIYK